MAILNVTDLNWTNRRPSIEHHLQPHIHIHLQYRTMNQMKDDGLQSMPYSTSFYLLWIAGITIHTGVTQCVWQVNYQIYPNTSRIHASWLIYISAWLGATQSSTRLLHMNINYPHSKIERLKRIPRWRLPRQTNTPFATSLWTGIYWWAWICYAATVRKWFIASIHC